MEFPRIADLRQLDVEDGATSSRGEGPQARFLREIVTAGSVLARGVFEDTSVPCRRKPGRRRCAGKLRIGRHPQTDEIHWSCPVCGDSGVILHWQATRWDLGPDLECGRLVSLSAERARRLPTSQALPETCTPAQVIPLGPELEWCELDCAFPLSELYGHYSAEEEPVREEWLALSDLERQLLAAESHARAVPDWHPLIPSSMLHALVHSLAETHLAELGEAMLPLGPPLRGEERHQFVHQLGEVLIRQLLDPGAVHPVAIAPPVLSPAKRSKRRSMLGRPHES